MKRNLVCLLILILPMVGSAQELFLSGTVRGVKGEPVAAASVVLVTKKDIKISGQTISDADGKFRLQGVTGEAYVLQISGIGVKPLNREIPSFTPGDLGTITLQPASDSLQAVTVTGNRALITRKADRVIVNIENNPLAAGKSSLELLRLAPGVQVQDGDISINGLTHAMVMVNGKLIRMSGKELADFLSSLRAEEIASIEVIPNPPAEYDASAGGLINIIYKKQRKDGWNGSVGSSYEQGRYPGFGENARLSFKDNKLTMTGSYSINRKYSYGTTDNTRTSDHSDYNYQYSAFRKDTFNTDRIRAGLTYDIDKTQFLGVDYSHAVWTENSPFRSTTTIGLVNSPEITLQGLFPRNSRTSFDNLGANYSARLDTTGTTFTLLTDYTWTNSSNINKAITEYYQPGSASYNDSSYQNNIHGNSKVFSVDAKVDKPLGKSTGISLGGKLVRADIDNTVDFTSFGKTGWNHDPSQSYQYTYKENIYAGFADFNSKLWTMDLKLGLRTEYTTTDGYLVTNGSARDDKNSYLGWFPSLFLQKELNSTAGNDISLSVRRGIYRPDYTQLNPFIVYIDNYTSIQGNPYLKPQYANQLELTYTWHRSFSAGFVYQRANDVIFNILHSRPGDSLNTWYAPENLDTRDTYAFVLSAPFKIAKWWSLNNTFYFKQEKMKFADFSYNKPIVYFENSQDITLPRNYRLSVNAWYQSAYYQGNIAVNGFYRVDLGAQKSLFKNKLVARFNVNDLFNSQKSISKIVYQDFVQNGREKSQTQSFVLQLIYNFSIGKSFTARSIDRSNDDERSRLGEK